MNARLKQTCLGTLQQLLVLAGLVFGVSWVNSYSEALLAGLFGSSLTRWLFASIGTPVHEISHALVALLFGYDIVEFRPFIPDPSSSTLGYVLYRYNPQYPLQQLGHFFVGIAPVLLPLAFIYLLYRLLVPRDLLYDGRLQFRKLLDLRLVLFVFLTAQIVLHMRCSPEDLQGAALGLPLLILILFLLGLIWPKAQRYLLAGSTMLTLLILGLAVIDHILVRFALIFT